MYYTGDCPEAIAIQSDGKIVIVGHRRASDVSALRYNSNGTLDNTFGGGGMVIYDGSRLDQGFAVGMQQDGK